MAQDSKINKRSFIRNCEACGERDRCTEDADGLMACRRCNPVREVSVGGRRWTRADFRVLADEDGIIRSKRNSTAVKIWDDGTVTRADVDLTLTKRLTLRDAAKLLRLRSEDLGHAR